MAANDTAPEAAEAAGEETPATEETPKPGRAGLLGSPVARIGLFVLLLGINALVSFLVVQKVIRPRVGTVEAVEPEIPRPEVPEPGELYVIENIIVNPAGTRATRHMRVGAALEYQTDQAELGAELERRSFQFRDLLITELSSRTIDELMDARVKEEIREDLLARLNGSLAAGRLSRLYFTEYVIQ